MGWIILGIVILIIIVLLAQLKAKTQSNSKIDAFPYIKQNVLFSPAERSFLGVLHQAIGNDAQIFGKVRVADVITPKKGITKTAWQKAFNKISAKHFDFILCDKEDLSIICAIELDDASHNTKTRQSRDQFLKAACTSSGLPLIQIPAKSSYNINELRTIFSNYLKTNSKIEEIKEISESTRFIIEPPTSKEKSIEKLSDDVEDELNNDKNKLCPKCSSQLSKKVAKKGNDVGNEFWACSAFPKCRYTEAVL